MKKLTLVTSLTLLALTTNMAFARTILVTDIDDTIKVSHVLDPDSAIANAVRTDSPFMGMSELYQEMVQNDKIDDVVYLSTAPESVMGKFHRKFLKVNKFPEGDLIMNQKLVNNQHKVQALRKIITERRPDQLILIGDNGEKDTLVYAQITKEFPDTNMVSFIHLPYSTKGEQNHVGKKLEEGQTGYASSIELAAQLLNRKLISEKTYLKLLNSIAPLVLKEGNKEERGRPLMFPAWFDCRDLKPLSVPSLGADTELVSSFNKKSRERCSVAPYEN